MEKTMEDESQRREYTGKLRDTFFVLVFGLMAVVIAAAVIGFIGWVFGGDESIEKEQLERIETKIEEVKQVIVPPYQQKDGLQKAMIVSDFQNTVMANQPTQAFDRQLKVEGEFEKGFLYVIANVDEKPLTQHDSIFVKLTATIGGVYEEFGGHIRRDKSLETPVSDNNTTLLYRLSDIPYKESFPYREDIKALSVDWLKVLNEGEGYRIILFSSTTRKGAIKELTIYYECAKESVCSITPIEK